MTSVIKFENHRITRDAASGMAMLYYSDSAAIEATLVIFLCLPHAFVKSHVDTCGDGPSRCGALSQWHD